MTSDAGVSAPAYAHSVDLAQIQREAELGLSGLTSLHMMCVYCLELLAELEAARPTRYDREMAASSQEGR